MEFAGPHRNRRHPSEKKEDAYRTPLPSIWTPFDSSRSFAFLPVVAHGCLLSGFSPTAGLGIPAGLPVPPQWSGGTGPQGPLTVCHGSPPRKRVMRQTNCAPNKIQQKTCKELPKGPFSRNPVFFNFGYIIYPIINIVNSNQNLSTQVYIVNKDICR